MHFFGHKLRFLVNILHFAMKVPGLTFSYNCYTGLHAKIQQFLSGGSRDRYLYRRFFECLFLTKGAAKRVPPRRGKNGWETTPTT